MLPEDLSILSQYEEKDETTSLMEKYSDKDSYIGGMNSAYASVLDTSQKGVHEKNQSVFEEIHSALSDKTEMNSVHEGLMDTSDLNVDHQNSLFNIKGQNLGTMGVLERMSGMVANREDLDMGDISLSETYRDKSLDTKVMGGLYNFTLTDVYEDRDRWLQMQGAFTFGGMIKGKNDAEIETDNYGNSGENNTESAAGTIFSQGGINSSKGNIFNKENEKENQPFNSDNPFSSNNPFSLNNQNEDLESEKDEKGKFISPKSLQEMVENERIDKEEAKLKAEEELEQKKKDEEELKKKEKKELEKIERELKTEEALKANKKVKEEFKKDESTIETINKLIDSSNTKEEDDEDDEDDEETSLRKKRNSRKTFIEKTADLVETSSIYYGYNAAKKYKKNHKDSLKKKNHIDTQKMHEILYGMDIDTLKETRDANQKTFIKKKKEKQKKEIVEEKTIKRFDIKKSLDDINIEKKDIPKLKLEEDNIKIINKEKKKEEIKPEVVINTFNPNNVTLKENYKSKEIKKIKTIDSSTDIPKPKENIKNDKPIETIKEFNPNDIINVTKKKKENPIENTKLNKIKENQKKDFDEMELKKHQKKEEFENSVKSFFS